MAASPRTENYSDGYADLRLCARIHPRAVFWRWQATLGWFSPLLRRCGPRCPRSRPIDERIVVALNLNDPLVPPTFEIIDRVRRMPGEERTMASASSLKI